MALAAALRPYRQQLEAAWAMDRKPSGRRQASSTDANSRYMTFEDVARQLQVSADSVRAKVLTGELAGADVGNGTQRKVLRVLRSSFDAYCERIEAEAARRFGADSRDRY
jgi:hypothetical protein